MNTCSYHENIVHLKYFLKRVSLFRTRGVLSDDSACLLPADPQSPLCTKTIAAYSGKASQEQ